MAVANTAFGSSMVSRLRAVIVCKGFASKSADLPDDVCRNQHALLMCIADIHHLGTSTNVQTKKMSFIRWSYNEPQGKTFPVLNNNRS